MFHITRTQGNVLTGIAAALYLFLGIAFADDYFTGTFWNGDAIGDSSFVSWLLLLAIIAGGLWQTQHIPDAGVTIGGDATTATGQVDDPAAWRLVQGNTYLAVLWMPLRFFIGHEWLAAGEHKLRDSAWMDGGTALKGFWTGAVAIPETGNPKITYTWFRDFLQYMLDHEWYTWFAKLIATGEFLIGLGLIVGALVGIAAFFGTVLNFNFLMAGTTSTNPVLFGLGVLIVLGWKVAGFIGLDRILLPALGTPWHAGRLLHREHPDDRPQTPATRTALH